MYLHNNDRALFSYASFTLFCRPVHNWGFSEFYGELHLHFKPQETYYVTHCAVVPFGYFHMFIHTMTNAPDGSQIFPVFFTDFASFDVSI